MFNNYPTAEQIFFIRDLIHNPQRTNLTETEQEQSERLQNTLHRVEHELLGLQLVLNEICDEKLTEMLKADLDPFSREGVIFMGAGHYSEYREMRLHEYLAQALSVVGGMQQPTHESEDEIDTRAAREYLEGFLTKLAEKLGVSGISFENSSKTED
jgi:hypothetical protein